MAVRYGDREESQPSATQVSQHHKILYITLWEKHAQLPAVDMLKVQGILWCYSNLSTILIQPSLDAQSLCTLHSDCAKKSTHANIWSLDGLEHAECQLQAVDQVFFCSVGFMSCQNHIQPFTKIKEALGHDAITVL